MGTAYICCGPLVRPPAVVAHHLLLLLLLPHALLLGEARAGVEELLATESRRHRLPRYATTSPTHRLPPTRVETALARAAPPATSVVRSQGRGRREGVGTEDLREECRPTDTDVGNPSHHASTTPDKLPAERTGTSMGGKDLRSMVVFFVWVFFRFSFFFAI